MGLPALARRPVATMSRALVGRSIEIAWLTAALERAIAGEGRVVLLSGEAGIGKTRVAEELGRLAEMRGASVLWGRAWEVEGAPACWPWSQIVTACVRTAGGKDFLDGDPRARGLMSLVEPTHPSRDSGTPEVDSVRRGAAVLALLERLTADRLVVLVFDDLHASDLASLALLAQVAAELPKLRLLIVGTYRERELRSRPRHAALIARAARAGATRKLPPLERDAVAEWLEAALGAPPSPELTAAVFGVTEGNSLFVDAVTQLLIARGDASWHAGDALPDSVLATIRESLDRVTPGSRSILDAAAVLGRDCSLTTLQLLTAVPMSEVLAAAGEGIAGGVLAEPPAPSSELRFAHVLVREALYQALPPARRVELHAAAARALAKAHAHDLDAHVAELAHHAFAGAALGSWLEAADYASRAAFRSLDLLAFDDAIRHLEQALTAIDRAGSDDDARRAELLWRLGVARIRLGQTRVGRAACERAARLAERAGEPAIFARAALALGTEVASGSPDVRLVAALQTALRLPLEDEALRALVMARLAAARMPDPSDFDALELAREAIRRARVLGDARVLAQVISTARAAMTPGDDVDERLALDRELVGLAASLGDRLLGMQAHLRLALDAIERGEARTVEIELAIAQEWADELRLPNQQLRVACARLAWATLTDDDVAFASADARVTGLCELVEEDANGRASREANRKLRAELRGDAAAAAAADDAWAALLAREPSFALTASIRRAWSLAVEGRGDEAREEVGRFMGEGPPSIPRRPSPYVATRIAQVFIALRDRAWLEPLYDKLLAYAGLNTISVATIISDGPVDYHLGQIAVALDREEAAAAHFDAALRLCRRAGFPTWAARIEEAKARLGVALAAFVPAAPAPPPELRRDGELWTLCHAGRKVSLADSKGVAYLAALLREPGREFHVGSLLGLTAAPVAGGGLDSLSRASSPGDAGVMLDERAKASYRRRLETLADALEDAEDRGDRERAARIEDEREQLARELARAVGLGGRDRKASSASERARINVQRRLRDVTRRVTAIDAPLGRHLALHIKTGIFCSWLP